MTKNIPEDKIFRCLACCEYMIEKNLILAKKWKNSYMWADSPAAVPSEEIYQERVNEWKAYREKIRSLVSNRYPLKEIIRRSKACKKKATQKETKELVQELDCSR